MKLALFNDYIPAVVVGDKTLVDVSKAVGDEVMKLRPHERMAEIIANFERLRPAIEKAAQAGGGVPVAGARLRAPLPRPSKILCAIGNFYEGTKTPIRPLALFLKSPAAVLDPGGTVELPKQQANVFHHEAEIAIVIGRRAKNVSQSDAMNYVFGFTCFMDISARGLGDNVGFIGKSFDTFAPHGPWIVTRDEIPDPNKLSIRMWNDEQPRHDYNTSDMEHPPAELVSYASSISTLEPGDLISCGTNHQQIGPVQDGETVTIEIERIGRFSVKIHDEQKRKWPKEVDRAMADFTRGRRTDPATPVPAILRPREGGATHR
ncbi:MAG TPA: fumarylacetoacetate hydrolase family protein [Candidatus Binataceae bacterium]|nr:fumarylacetoacetate hydrolase family protein [Candidatus Binataceae bacterium]HVB82576.1 fumarylacetoacetate hydrolase family protein [Candidatus Binataceae bacterium]